MGCYALWLILWQENLCNPPPQQVQLVLYWILCSGSSLVWELTCYLLRLLLRPRSSHMLPIQAFATKIKVFDLQKALDCSLLRLECLIFRGSKVKLQLCVLDPLILAVQRSPWFSWLAPKRGLIQFWSQSQTLLHGTYKWLPLVRPRPQLDRIPHVIMTKSSLLPRLSVYPHLIYCKLIRGAWKWVMLQA